MQKYLKRFIFPSKIKIFPGKKPGHIALVLIFILYLTNPVSLYAEKKSSIAVMDFSSGNIPLKYRKIIRSEIEYNFFRTDDFIVLEREKIDIVLNEHRIREISREKRGVMVSIGKTLSADYVLTGDIQKGEKENTYIVKLRVINIQDGAVLYVYSKNLDDLTDIKGFTKTVSENVISDIKYYNAFGKVKEREEIDKQDIIENKAAGKDRDIATDKKAVPDKSSEKKLKTNLAFNFALIPEYIHAFGLFSKDVDYGYGAKLYCGADNLFIKDTGLGIETGVIRLEPSQCHPGFFLLVPVLLDLRYSYFFYKNFFLSPEIKTGSAYLLYKCRDKAHKSDYDENTIEIMSQAGIVIGTRIQKRIDIALSAGCGMFFEKRHSMNFLVFNLGVFVFLL